MERFSNVERLLEETKKCLDVGLVFPALFMALSIPDACGKDKWPGLKVGERYEKWFHDYVDPLFNMISYYKGKSPDAIEMDGHNTYLLRCALLHNGETELGEKANIDDFWIDTVTKGMGFIAQSGRDARWNGAGWEPKTYIHVRAYPFVGFIVEGAENYLREAKSARSPMTE